MIILEIKFFILRLRNLLWALQEFHFRSDRAPLTQWKFMAAPGRLSLPTYRLPKPQFSLRTSMPTILVGVTHSRTVEATVDHSLLSINKEISKRVVEDGRQLSYIYLLFSSPLVLHQGCFRIMEYTYYSDHFPILLEKQLQHTSATIG